MLRFATRLTAPQLAAHARGKSTTGLVGLKVQPEARSMLEGLYTRTLTELQAFPPTAE
jgi:NADH dehydrogenase (ubiquinone) 1 alpha subcomplex subunit 5